MRADCHVCRSEGFEARSRVRVSTGGKSLLATLNVIKSALLGLEEASLSEAAWTLLDARDGDVIEVTHAEPVESERFVRAKAYGERLPDPALSAIVNDIARPLFRSSSCRLCDGMRWQPSRSRDRPYAGDDCGR
jgi:thymidine phosphorylase